MVSPVLEEYKLRSGVSRGRCRTHSYSSPQVIDDGLNLHVNSAKTLISQSLLYNMLKSFNTSWRLFGKFQHTYPQQQLSNIKYLLAFVAFCHSNLKLSHNMIKLYLSGIQHFQSLECPDSPSLFSTHAIRAILKEISKVNSTPDSTRQPMSEQLFRSLAQALTGMPFGHTLSLLIKTAMYLAYYSFLRLGEFSKTHASSAFLRKSKIVWCDSFYDLTLHSAKTLAPGNVVEIKYFPTGNAWCPVMVILEWLRVISGEPPDSPLFPTSGVQLTTAVFMKYMRVLLSNMGVNPMFISGHSFRIGAASE
ncbi:uncharacterized protein LOC130361465 [Hyla sarda]|uniref:uncharacterized protein LOC130361465 n=1 Tax=Hyla sarda TaxID=327740 RepID=UPI0024C2185E|nr:uncharacterized protein LOC130361465 [Hyla sarda]